MTMQVQTDFAGGDWLSDRDRKRQSRAEEAHRKQCKRTAKALRVAADELSALITTHLATGAEDRMGHADGRRRLAWDCLELAAWLEQNR